MLRRFVLAMICLIPLTAWAAAGRDPYSYFFNETFGNFVEELQQARAQGKQAVLVFYEMDECPFCHYMKQNVLNQPEVQEYFRAHFLNFSVDIEGDIEVTDFANHHVTQKEMAKAARVRATPVIAFYDLNGKEIYRHTGRTSDAAEFLLLGKYVADGIYKQQPFIKYKREQRN